MIAKIQNFNPRSWAQVGELARHLGASLPKVEGSLDADEKLSTERKNLLRVAKKHPIFNLVLECRERSTLLTRYMWRLDEKLRVKTQLGFHPSTWRFSSRAENLFNIPKRSDLAEAFRRLIVAPTGFKLVEGDSSAIEAVLVGYFAGDEGLVRLAKAGIHDWLAAAYHGEPIATELDDTALAGACRAAKKRWPGDHDKLKRIVYLSTYCGTPNRIYQEYPDDFPDTADAGGRRISGLREARKLQDYFFSTSPGQAIKKWQRSVLERAHQEVTLENPWKYRHSFYSVFQWDTRKQDLVLGDDAKRAVAFMPQSTAAAIQREIMLKLAEVWPEWCPSEGSDPYGRLPIYDSLVNVVPEAEAKGFAYMLREVMQQPWPQLQGLSIGCKVQVGSNLGEHSEENPEGMEEV